MPEDELQKVLVEWNATEREYPRDATLSQLFEAQVTRFAGGNCAHRWCRAVELCGIECARESGRASSALAGCGTRENWWESA